MDTQNLAEPCVNCGRTHHRIVFLGGRPYCGELPLDGWEPAVDVARISTDDGSWPGFERHVRAVRCEGAEIDAFGDWRFETPEGQYVDRSELYLPELTKLAVDVDRVTGVSREMLAVASALADKLSSAAWTSPRSRADGLAIAARARRIAERLVPDVFAMVGP